MEPQKKTTISRNVKVNVLRCQLQNTCGFSVNISSSLSPVFPFFFQLRRKHGWFRIWYSDSSRRRFVRKRERETVRDRQEREVERQTGRQDRACCGFVQRRIAPRTGCTAHAPESRRHYCWTRFSSRLVSPSFHFSDFPLMSQNEFWFDKASFHRQPSWPI